jgi:hypothetical protein
LLAPHPIKPSEMFSVLCYGDDQILGFDHQMAPWVTYQSIADGFKRIGMKFTDETKGEITCNYKKLSDISFLKRTFKYSKALSRWTMPLDKRSIYGMCYWIQKSSHISDKEALASNFETAMAEMALHGREEFEYFRDQIIQLASKYQLHVEFKTYTQHLDAFNAGYALTTYWSEQWGDQFFT